MTTDDYLIIEYFLQEKTIENFNTATFLTLQKWKEKYKKHSKKKIQRSNYQNIWSSNKYSRAKVASVLEIKYFNV